MDFEVLRPVPSPRAIDVKTEHVGCAVCRADQPVPYRAGMYRIGAARFDLVRCTRCGLVYVNPRPDGATLEALYDDPLYYTDGYNLGVETDNYFDRKDELIAQYGTTLAQYEHETGARAGDLLELGSAGGFLLEAGRRRGWRVKGVELSPPAAAYAVRTFGLDVFCGVLEDAPPFDSAFDLAVADNVLEHTLRPDDVLARLRALLRPGGHVIIIVPAYVNSAWFRVLQRTQGLLPRRLLGNHVLKLLKFAGDDAGYPYHVLEFDRRTLTRLVREAGFDIVKTESSVPLPAHLFKARSPTVRTRCLRATFALLDRCMRAGVLPGVRLRIVARRTA